MRPLPVLREARRPLTSREITERAVEQGLIAPAGKTPEATMSAALYARTRPIPRMAEWGRLVRGAVAFAGH